MWADTSVGVGSYVKNSRGHTGRVKSKWIRADGVHIGWVVELLEGGEFRWFHSDIPVRRPPPEGSRVRYSPAHETGTLTHLDACVGRIQWDSGRVEILGRTDLARLEVVTEVSPVTDKKDDGKDRWDLLPWEAVAGVVKVLTFGAKKYSDDGWRKVPNGVERYKAALFRHAVAWASGETKDPETGYHHLWHVACNAVILYELTKEGK